MTHELPEDPNVSGLSKANVKSQENPKKPTENTTESVKNIFISTLKEPLPSFWGKGVIKALAYLILIIWAGLGIFVFFLIWMIPKNLYALFITLGYLSYQKYTEKGPKFRKSLFFILSTLFSLAALILGFVVLVPETIIDRQAVNLDRLKEKLIEYSQNPKKAKP
jgi:hypothetical protein